VGDHFEIDFFFRSGFHNERNSTLLFKFKFGDEFELVHDDDAEEVSAKSLGPGVISPAELIGIILGCVTVTGNLIAGMVLIW
jgi:hypothetical protein